MMLLSKLGFNKQNQKKKRRKKRNYCIICVGNCKKYDINHSIYRRCSDSMISATIAPSTPADVVLRTRPAYLTLEPRIYILSAGTISLLHHSLGRRAVPWICIPNPKRSVLPLEPIVRLSFVDGKKAVLRDSKGMLCGFWPT